MTDASPPAPSTGTKTGVAVAAGATVGGIFTFGLLQQLGMDSLFRAAHTATSWLFAITITCILIILILIAGAEMLNRDKPDKTSPLLWVSIGIFGLIVVGGFISIVLMSFSDPVIDVQVRLGSGTNLAALQDTPPLNLTEYFNGEQANPVPAVAGTTPWTYPMQASKPLVIDIANFGQLANNYTTRTKQVTALQSQLQDAAGIFDLARSACIYVPKTVKTHDLCVPLLDQPS